jgi:hypothetical protein
MGCEVIPSSRFCHGRSAAKDVMSHDSPNQRTQF